MKRIIKWLNQHFEETVLGVFLLIITVVIFLQVVMRYAFSSALPWPEEFTRYCLVCSTLLSLSYCIHKDIMLKVDLLVGFMPGWLQKILEILIDFISLGLYAYLMVHSVSTVQIARNSMQLSPAMQLPMYLIYAWGTFSFAMTCLRMIQRLYLTIFVKKGEECK